MTSTEKRVYILLLPIVVTVMASCVAIAETQDIIDDNQGNRFDSSFIENLLVHGKCEDTVLSGILISRGRSSVMRIRESRDRNSIQQNYNYILEHYWHGKLPCEGFPEDKWHYESCEIDKQFGDTINSAWSILYKESIRAQIRDERMPVRAKQYIIYNSRESSCDPIIVLSPDKGAPLLSIALRNEFVRMINGRMTQNGKKALYEVCAYIEKLANEVSNSEVISESDYCIVSKIVSIEIDEQGRTVRDAIMKPHEVFYCSESQVRNEIMRHRISALKMSEHAMLSDLLMVIEDELRFTETTRRIKITVPAAFINKPAPEILMRSTQMYNVPIMELFYLIAWEYELDFCVSGNDIVFHNRDGMESGEYSWSEEEYIMSIYVEGLLKRHISRAHDLINIDIMDAVELLRGDLRNEAGNDAIPIVMNMYYFTRRERQDISVQMKEMTLWESLHYLAEASKGEIIIDKGIVHFIDKESRRLIDSGTAKGAVDPVSEPRISE